MKFQKGIINYPISSCTKVGPVTSLHINEKTFLYLLFTLLGMLAKLS